MIEVHTNCSLRAMPNEDLPLQLIVQELLQDVFEVENNAFAKNVLRARMQDKMIGEGPIYSDVTQY